MSASLRTRNWQHGSLVGTGALLGAGSFFIDPTGHLPAGLADIVSGLPWAMMGVGGKGLWATRDESQAVKRRAAERARQRRIEEEDATDGVVSIAGVGLGGVDIIAWGAHASLRTSSAPAGERRGDERVRGPVQEHPRALREAAAIEGRSLFDGRKVDVRSLRRHWNDDETREVHLTTSETSYYPYLAQSHSLDVAMPGLPERARSLRHLWEGDRPCTWRDVADLPAPVSLGTVTVARTSDGYLLAGARGDTAQSGSAPRAPQPAAPLKPWQVLAGQQAPACGSVSDPQYADPQGRKLLHFVAEGVIPEDVDEFSGDIDVRRTAVRGIKEELGEVCAAGRITLTSLHPRTTAVFFDQVRWEVVVTHVVDLDVDLATVRRHASLARDRFETQEWIALDATDPQDPEMCQLLHGTHPSWVLASNHALVALVFALLDMHQERVPRHGFVQRNGAAGRRGWEHSQG